MHLVYLFIKNTIFEGEDGLLEKVGNIVFRNDAGILNKKEEANLEVYY